MKIDRWDVMAAAGCICLMVGLVLIDWRYAVVAFGVILWIVGILGAANSGRVRQRR